MTIILMSSYVLIIVIIPLVVLNSELGKRVTARGGKAGLIGIIPRWRGRTLGGARERWLPRAEERRAADLMAYHCSCQRQPRRPRQAAPSLFTNAGWPRHAVDEIILPPSSCGEITTANPSFGEASTGAVAQVHPSLCFFLLSIKTENTYS